MIVLAVPLKVDTSGNTPSRRICRLYPAAHVFNRSSALPITRRHNHPTSTSAPFSLPKRSEIERR